MTDHVTTPRKYNILIGILVAIAVIEYADLFYQYL